MYERTFIIHDVKNQKFMFKTEARVGKKYENSPFYRGTVLWNKLRRNSNFQRIFYCLNPISTRCIRYTRNDYNKCYDCDIYNMYFY